MKKTFLCVALCFTILMGYGQTSHQSSRLKKIVEGIHQNLREVATMSGVPYQSSANWAEVVYIQSADSLITVPFDSLKNGYNNIDYDIKIVFDKEPLAKSQFLQGIIILEPIGKARLENLQKRMLDMKEKKKNNFIK